MVCHCALHFKLMLADSKPMFSDEKFDFSNLFYKKNWHESDRMICNISDRSDICRQYLQGKVKYFGHTRAILDLSFTRLNLLALGRTQIRNIFTVNFERFRFESNIPRICFKALYITLNKTHIVLFSADIFHKLIKS